MKERILRYIAKIKNKTITKDEFEFDRLDAVAKVTSQYSSNNLESFTNVNPYDFFLAYLCLTCQPNYYDDLKEIAELFKPIFNLKDINQVKINANFICDYIISGKEISFKEVDGAIIEIKPSSFVFTDDMKLLEQLVDPDDLNFNGGKEAILALIELCEYISTLESLDKKVDDYNKSSKVKRQAKQILLKGIYKESGLDKLTSNLDKYAVFLLNKKQEIQKKYNKRNRMLDEIVNKIENDLLTTVEKDWEGIDFVLAKVLYNYVLMDIQNEHDEIRRRIDAIEQETTTTKLENILCEYGIHVKDFDDKVIDVLLSLNIDKISNTLEQLKSFDISPSQLKQLDIATAIKYGNNETISGICRLLKSEVLKTSFLAKHPFSFVSINDSENGLFEKISMNCTTLKNLNINFMKDGFNDEIFLTDSDDLKNNANLINEYGLCSLKQSSIVGLLHGSLSFDAIDAILEENGNVNEIGRLKLSNNELLLFKKRAHIANEMGLFSQGKVTIGSSMITKGTKFILADEELSKSIPDIGSKYINNDIKKILDDSKRNIITDLSKNNTRVLSLDNYLSNNKVTYNFDGITISRAKVLRNMETLLSNGINSNEALFNSIIYGTFLRRDQVLKLKQITSDINIKSKELK